MEPSLRQLWTSPMVAYNYFHVVAELLLRYCVR